MVGVIKVFLITEIIYLHDLWNLHYLDYWKYLPRFYLKFVRKYLYKNFYGK